MNTEIIRRDLGRVLTPAEIKNLERYERWQKKLPLLRSQQKLAARARKPGRYDEKEISRRKN